MKQTFSPVGTALERFRQHDLEIPARAGDDGHVFAGLTRTRVGSELGEGMVHLAWETAGYALEGDPRSTLARLILLSLMNGRLGSTRLPVESDGGQWLRRMISEWLPAVTSEDTMASGVGTTSGESAVVDADLVYGAMVDLLHSPGVVDVVGRTADAYKPFLYVDGSFYHQRMHVEEQHLVDRLRMLLQREPHTWPGADVRSSLQDVLTHAPEHDGIAIRLEDDQQYAVLTAVHSPLTLISGGPGTGKTTVVVSILRLLQRLGGDVADVALAAPTGKAAFRMGDAIRRGLQAVPAPAESGKHSVDRHILDNFPEPLTLHRLLGYSPVMDRFRRHHHNRLPAKVVIVDEASMIDLNMMDRLLNALEPDARLILLGDADQLPSVDAGAILRELMPSRTDHSTLWRAYLGDGAGGAASPEGAAGEAHPLAGCAVQLVNSYRMDPRNPSGRAVLTAAQRINAGNAPGLLDGRLDEEPLLSVRDDATQLVFDKVEWLPLSTGTVETALKSFVSTWYTRRVRALDDFDALVTRTYRFGQIPAGEEHMAGGLEEADHQALDRLFSHFDRSRILAATRMLSTGTDAIHRHLRTLVEAEDRPRAGGSFFVGEPVMMLQNDYEHGLFNGDQGLILQVAGSARAHPMAVFPRQRGYAAFHLDTLRERLRLSYAITVHKSQGSEFDTVAMLLPTEALPLLTRELLYTAVTRSRKSVVVIGSRDMLEYAVSRRSERHSGIGESLARKVGGTTSRQ